MKLSFSFGLFGKQNRVAAFVVALVFSEGGVARGELIAHEPFDYAEARPLHGAAGGRGWLVAAVDDGRSPASVGWAVQRARTDAGGYRIAAASPLAGARFPGSAAHLIGGWDYLSAGRTIDAAAPGAVPAWSDGLLLGKPGRPIYIAALLRADTANQSVFLNAHANRFASQVDRGRVSWGVFGGGAAAGFWGLRAGDGEVVRTDVAALPGEPALLLVKLEFTVSGAQFAGQASLWVNPRTGRAGEGDATRLPPPAVGVETGDIRFHSLAVYLGAGAGGGAVDEIRVGTTVESVLGER